MCTCLPPKQGVLGKRDGEKKSLATVADWMTISQPQTAAKVGAPRATCPSHRRTSHVPHDHHRPHAHPMTTTGRMPHDHHRPHAP